MANYYDNHAATSANSKSMMPKDDEEQHFPVEGLYFGSLSGGNTELPALFDLSGEKGLCFMYSDNNTR